MALGSGEVDFAGKLHLPLPKTFSGTPADWEEWSWNLSPTSACLMVKTLLDDVESRQTVLTDADLTANLDTGDVDNVAPRKPSTLADSCKSDNRLC